MLSMSRIAVSMQPAPSNNVPPSRPAGRFLRGRTPGAAPRLLRHPLVCVGTRFPLTAPKVGVPAAPPGFLVVAGVVVVVAVAVAVSGFLRGVAAA